MWLITTVTLQPFASTSYNCAKGGCGADALSVQVKIIGVEPAGANAMALSLQEGERVELAGVDTFADGVAVKQTGVECFR